MSNIIIENKENKEATKNDGSENSESNKNMLIRKKSDIIVIRDKKSKKPKMKKWPKNNTDLINAEKLLSPVKAALLSGYSLYRNNKKNIEYSGYNIGETELKLSPNPQERLSQASLERQEQIKKTLLDNILVIAFQLGIEQGRRFERSENTVSNDLNKCISIFQNEILRLSSKLQLLETLNEVRKENPNFDSLPAETQEVIIKSFQEKHRADRKNALMKDLQNLIKKV